MSAEKPEVEIPDGPPSYQLELEDLTVGDGDEAVAGKIVEVHYVGVSGSTGEQFDASWDRGDTFKFGLGKGQVIQGWDEGVAGMKVGGRPRLTLPAPNGPRARGARGGDAPRGQRPRRDRSRRDARVRGGPRRSALTRPDRQRPCAMHGSHRRERRSAAARR